jgi:hypothetical protein
MKAIKHIVAIKLVEQVLDLVPVINSGTYNMVDPTHYENGFSDLGWCTVGYNDVTWGVTLTIKDKEAGSRGRSIYFDGEDLTPQDNWVKGSFLMLREILKDMRKAGMRSKREAYFEERSMVDPMGCLEDYI